MKRNLLEKARQAKSFGILIDEVTNISVASQLISFLQFWDEESSSVATVFLSSQNVWRTLLVATQTPLQSW